MNVSCNTHAASFVKGQQADEYEDISELAAPLRLNGEYTFLYTYPLSITARSPHVLTPDMVGEDILAMARADYERIYKEEAEGDGEPGMIPGMLNRKTSAGPYGIWGHVFSDLYFEGFEVDHKTKEISFHMGS